MLVPAHDPVRYFPLAQLMLEQVAHAVLAAELHDLVVYCPVGHVVHRAHRVLETPSQPPILYVAAPHLEHVRHR